MPRRIKTVFKIKDLSISKCSELMASVIFNYWQYWTFSWTKVMFRGNSVPKVYSAHYYVTGTLMVDRLAC